MRYSTRAVFLWLLVLGVFLAMGCSEKSTGPDKNPPTSPGKHLWSKGFGDGYFQDARAVAVDTSGNAIVTGYFDGTVDFGGGALTSAGSGDIFVAKFASDGAHLWSKRFGDGSDQAARAVAVDASGNALITGYFVGTVDFGGGALTSAGGTDIFLAKFGRWRALGEYLCSLIIDLGIHASPWIEFSTLERDTNRPVIIRCLTL